MSAPATLPPLEPPTATYVPGTGIRRCAGPDGNTVFTDKRCEDMGAVDSAAPTAGNASTRLFVRSCARTREALVDGLRERVHEFVEAPVGVFAFVGAQIVMRGEGGYVGGSDPRADGQAVGF